MNHRVMSIAFGRILPAALVVLTVCLVGCGGGGAGVKTGTVQGKVLLKGQPMTKGTIFFSIAKGGDSATGEIQSDGTYTLRYQSGFSIPVGDYAVSVIMDDSGPILSPEKLMEKLEKEGPAKVTETIPAKYMDAKTSGLIAVIKEGSNPSIDFDLK